MKTRDPVADVLDRYLFAVEQELPSRPASDVAVELRSLIEDAIEERARAAGRPATLADAVGVLTEMGEPASVARRFQPTPRYLIGPRTYPMFLKVMRIGLGALAAFVFGLAGLASVASGRGLGGLGFWGRLVGQYAWLAFALFTATVIVLAVLERVLPESARKGPTWSPLDLAPVPEEEPERVSPIGEVVGILLVAALALLANLAPAWLGLFMVDRGRPVFVPLADLGVVLPLALLNVWCGSSAVLKLVVLRLGRRPMWAQWAGVGLTLLAVATLFEIGRHSHLTEAPALSTYPQLRPMALAFGILLRVLPPALLVVPGIETFELLRRRRRVEPPHVPGGTDGGERREAGVG